MEEPNTPSTEHHAILERLNDAMGRRDVPPYFWAACQICDPQSLQKLVDIARISPGMIRLLAAQTEIMIKYWTQNSKGQSRNTSGNTSRNNTPKKPSATELSSPEPSTSKPSALSSSPTGTPPAKRQKTIDSLRELSRDHRASELAKERDHNECVLTGDPCVHAAHIYPFYALKTSEKNIFGARHIFWNHLRIFWSDEKVNAWERELFPQGLSSCGTELVENRITLSGGTHTKWNRGAFALMPLALTNDKTTLTVKFYWQKKQHRTQETMSLLTEPHPTTDLNENIGSFDDHIVKLFGRNDCRIKSGDTFVLKTNDPITRPLPSFKLLELQWFLTRIVGMAGAAIPYDPDWNDDSDEEVIAALPYDLDWVDDSDEEASNPGLSDS